MKKLVQIGDFNFRFECLAGCTNCCTQDGEVYLTAEDVRRIADYLNLTPKDFRGQYCEVNDGDLQLTTPAHKDCHFLAEGACAVHPVKPLQCRTYPFWPENVRSKRAWKNVGHNCPGVGVGPVVSMKEVRADAQACQDAFPDL